MLTRREILQQAGAVALATTTAPWWLVRRAHAARQYKLVVWNTSALAPQVDKIMEEQCRAYAKQAGIKDNESGYSLVAGGSSHRRAEWSPWGNPGDYVPEHQDYLKYSASVTKDYFFGLHKIHLNAAYFGGEDLDRFSKYQFGFFDDTRIHGVPSSGVRFSELGMLRGSYSFNLFEQYRLDLFLDQAFGNDPDLEVKWKPITGVGIGFNMRGPWSTLIRGEVGKSFLPDEYREPGSMVFQLQILKPL